jgi:uncharacterized membrane protein
MRGVRMNWLLGLIGALLGAALSDAGAGFGAVVGFTLVFMLASQVGLRRRVDALAAELQTLRGRLAAQAIADSTRAMGDPAAGAAAAAGPASVRASAPPDAATVRPPPSPTRATANATPAPATANASPSGPAAAPSPGAAPASGAPNWSDKLLARGKAWFTEGNVPVKVGVLVLLFGVAAALRYAAAQGYFTMPIEVRLASIAAAALAGMGWGWRERLRRPAFGLSLQGGALGVLLLTVFAAFRLYGLLPATAALALVVVLVAGAAALAVLQDAMWLALLGFLGGYLAPVLISTGSGNHVALFSYYAVLNAAVFAISWRRSWRLLNLLGFAFTFGVGAAWGASFYRPELFASVEPFLVLFFAFYIVIGLVYVLRQSAHRRPWVDGTLVFGTPLVAFPMQAALLRDDRMGLAFSALAVALVYAGLVYFLRARRGERLLTEAYGALALGFATLAVPLAFSASTTASVWALEGAGAAWLGLRQGRRFPWLAGLGLQLLAAGAYLTSMDQARQGIAPVLLLNAAWLGAAMLSFSGFALSLVHDRHQPRFGIAAASFWWAMAWWAIGGLLQLELARRSIGAWPFAALYLAVSMAIAAGLRIAARWPRLDGAIATCAFGGLLLAPTAEDRYAQPIAPDSWPYWLAFAAAGLGALRALRQTSTRGLVVAHLSVLWTLALVLTLQARSTTTLPGPGGTAMADGWQALAQCAPLALMSLLLWRRPQWLSWPRAGLFDGYRWGWFAPALALLGLAWLAALMQPGDAAPLGYLPLLNPLELTLVGVALFVLGFAAGEPALRPLRQAAPLLAFAVLTMGVLRAVHHLHGDAWSPSLLRAGVAQTSLTVAWSLLGVSAWILGSRRCDRRIWWAGALLMAVVLGKLALVDRQYMGNVAGIVSFLAVGLLLVGVGYVAPSPGRGARESIA